MKLDDNFEVTGKKYEWTLTYKEEVKKDDKTVTKTGTWHYPNLKQVLKKYIDESLKPLESITKMLNRLDELEDIIEKITVK